MADPKIRIRRSSTPNKVPNITQLELGELAINTYDGKIYLEQDQGAAGVGNTVVRINPWNVGLGTTAFNITFESGKVGIGTTVARHALDVGGNARISGILTVGESSVTLNGGNNTVQVGTALSLGHSIGLQYHTQNLHAEGFLVNQIAASGIITAAGGIDGIGIHSAGTEIQVGVITSLNFIGTGNTFGVGIGTTVTVAGRGGNQTTPFFNNETKEVFIPTRSFYLPNHPFKTGDKVEYNPGAGTSIKYQTNAMRHVNVTFTRPLPPEVFVQVIDNNLIGIVTSQSHIGFDTNRVMLSANAGIGNTHFFKTKKDVVTGTIRIINTTATSNNHTCLSLIHI